MRQPCQLTARCHNFYSMPNLKKTLSFLVVSFIAVAQFAAFAPKAQACLCAFPDPDPQKMVEKAWEEYDVIFSGEVTSVSKTKYDDDGMVPPIPYATSIFLQVFQNWKGINQGQSQVIRTGDGEFDCGYTFQKGERYLVYAQKYDVSDFITSGCGPTKKLVDASEDIKYLNKLSSETSTAQTNDPSMPPGGTLNVITKEGEGVKEFPLKHTDVRAEIYGFISRVTVTQEFVNPYTEPIEAVYTFPLPQNAAVDAMEMKIGERVIKAQIKKREEARQLYEEAKDSGRRAGLLEQERPNIFTQSVANILPEDSIFITIQYIETLEYERGTYTFVFPMTVGPRYIPFGGVAGAESITPPVLKPGERSGHDISLAVEIDAGFAINDIRSKNHKILKVTDYFGSVNRSVYARYIELSALDSIPNKDFILEYDVGGDEPQFTLLTHKKPDSDHGYFVLIAQPQLTPTQDEITPKEMIFVVDSSGSMHGEPISRVKQVMRYAIKNLNPNDTFYLFSFSNEVSALSETPLANTPENIEKGLRYINELEGGGGTEMLKGVKAAYALPKDDNRLRYVVMLTDGYIGNEDAILAEIQANQNDARFFSFGIGSSPNRFLIEQMAMQGKGLSFYLNLTEDSDKVIRNFYERIANPVLTDISVNFGSAEVAEVYPNPIQDIFSAKPLYVIGKYTVAGYRFITIKGKIQGEPFETQLLGENPEDVYGAITFPQQNTENEGLASIWARQKVKSLEASMYRGENPQTVEEITNLALAYSIVTKYTSFVAFEEKPVTDQPGKTVQVPVELPEGASYEGIFGSEDSAVQETYSDPSGYAPSGSLGQAQDRGTTFGGNIGVRTSDVRDTVRTVANLLLSGLGILFLIITIISSAVLATRAFKKPPTSSRAKKYLIIGIAGLVIILIIWTIISYLSLGFSAAIG